MPRTVLSLYLLLVPLLLAMTRQFATQQVAANRFNVDPRTIRNWISSGLITGYRLPTGRAIRVDLAEIEAMVKAIPTVKARKQPFGPAAKIVDLRNVVSPIPGIDGESK